MTAATRITNRNRIDSARRMVRVSKASSTECGSASNSPTIRCRYVRGTMVNPKFTVSRPYPVYTTICTSAVTAATAPRAAFAHVRSRSQR